MDVVNYNDFRDYLKEYLKKVSDHGEQLIITNKNAEDEVVILRHKEYEALIETLKVVSNQYLMKKLQRGNQEASIGKTKQHQLINPD